jgi:hypothetical protein
MSLKHQIEEALKDALLKKDGVRRDAMRLLLSAIKKKEKDIQQPLDDSGVQQVIASQIKQRKESAEQFLRGGREDLVEQEEKEIEIFQHFMPEPLSSAELEAMVVRAIAETQAESPKDMGKVMKVLMPEVSGRAEGREVNEMVKRKLQS